MEDKNVCIREQADPRQINSCREKIALQGSAFTTLSAVLALAGNEVRLKILYLLEEEQELCPCDLSDILGMTIPAVSQHLRKMKDGHLITSRKTGQTIFYSVKPEHRKLLRPFFQIIHAKASAV